MIKFNNYIRELIFTENVVKQVILFFLIVLFIPVGSNAMQLADGILQERDCPTITQDDQTGDAICSFIVSLFSQAAEPASETYHLSSDTKHYLKLFFRIKHNNTHTSAFDNTTINTSPQIFPESERTVHYIYALRKIIV